MACNGRWGQCSTGRRPQCDFCQEGRVIARKQQLAFRRWTVRGYIHCRAEVPIGLCDRCASIHWNQEAEALIEEAVRRE